MRLSMDGGHGTRVPSPHGIYGVNFKQRHSQIQLRDPAASLRELDPEFLALGNHKGAGNAGRSARPAALQSKNARKQVTTVTPETPGIPRAMILRLISCSPATGLFCHRRPWLTPRP
jgi:hypothetical protein